LISIGKSNETSLFLNEFIEMVHFDFSLITTECLHSQIKGVHCSRHGTNKFWLILIYKTVDFVCVLLNLFSFFDHFRVWFFFIVTCLTASSSLVVFSILSMVWVLSTVVDSLLVVETLNFISVRDSLRQRFRIVGLHWSFRFRCLF